MSGTMLIVHGGAPTAVMNASLYGAIRAARDSGEVDRVLGARYGTRAIFTGDYIDLSAIGEEELELLPRTPASFIGTSRFPIEDTDYQRLVDALADQGIRYLLFNGGNGTMDTCGKLARAAARNPRAAGLRIVGIPKTIDNDLSGTDHAPGFGSAARYLAASVAELARDVAALPIHVCIVESMGRNAGWLTAAAALGGDASALAGEVNIPAREAASHTLTQPDRAQRAAEATPSAALSTKTPPILGPHLIYVPEVPFDEERFLDEAKTLYDRVGGVVVVVSEGLKDAQGKPIVPPVFQTGRSVYYGDVSAYLCTLVIRRLGIKARSEKPGILGRCSIAHQSSVDREEAILAGAEAARAAIAGHSAVMVGFKRISSSPYRVETTLVSLEDAMLHERSLPLEYLNTARNGIDESYLEWCRPLIGGPLATFTSPVGR